MLERTEAEETSSLLRIFAAALVLLVAAPLFWLQTQVGAITGDESLRNEALYSVTYPQVVHGFGRLSSGELPLWNPNQLAGAPFLANPSTGVFQPLNAVFLFLPAERAMAVHGFVVLFLMGFGFFLWMRSLECSYMASLLGAFVYAFANASSAAVVFPELANALAWAPFLLWSCHLLHARYTMGRVFFAALFLSLVWLSGSIPSAVVISLLATGYAMTGVFLPGKFVETTLSRRLTLVLLVPAIALCLTAIQWMPTVEWMFALDLPMGLFRMTRMRALAPESLVDVAVQSLSSQPSSTPRLTYYGIITLLLIPPAFLQRRCLRELGLAIAVVLLVLLFAVLPLGLGARPWYSATYFALLLACALLVSLGTDRLFAPRQRYRILQVVAPGLSAVVAAMGLFLVVNTEARGMIILFLALLVPYLLIRARWLGAGTAGVLCTLLFVDLVVSGGTSGRHPYVDAPGCYARYGGALRSAQSLLAGHRLLVLPTRGDIGLTPNLGMLLGMNAAGGTGISLSSEQAIWWRRLAGTDQPQDAAEGLVLTREPSPLTLLTRMGVSTILSPASESMSDVLLQRPELGWRLVETTDGIRVLANESALPRAYWVPQSRVVDGVGEAATLLSDPSFDANRICLVERRDGIEDAPAETPSDTFSRQSATISVEIERPETIQVRVTAPAPGWFVLLDSYAPGWRATVNEQPAVIRRANGLFRAVAVPSGEQIVTFRYQPWGILLGSIVSGLSVGLLMLASIVVFVRRV